MRVFSLMAAHLIRLGRGRTQVDQDLGKPSKDQAPTGSLAAFARLFILGGLNGCLLLEKGGESWTRELGKAFPAAGF